MEETNMHRTHIVYSAIKIYLNSLSEHLFGAHSRVGRRLCSKILSEVFPCNHYCISMADCTMDNVHEGFSTHKEFLAQRILSA